MRSREDESQNTRLPPLTRPTYSPSSLLTRVRLSCHRKRSCYAGFAEPRCHGWTAARCSDKEVHFARRRPDRGSHDSGGHSWPPDPQPVPSLPRPPRRQSSVRVTSGALHAQTIPRGSREQSTCVETRTLAEPLSLIPGNVGASCTSAAPLLLGNSEALRVLYLRFLHVQKNGQLTAKAFIKKK